jgi:uncharacterized protein YdiU (UPF0061 family)
MSRSKSLGFNFQHTYTHLPNEFYSNQKMKDFSSPKNIIFNEELASKLGLKHKALEEISFIIANGEQMPLGSKTIAQAYCGHQFGNFVNLGDGRALLLGEHLDSNQQRFDVQLKGSGPTKYSRGGDGLAALGPMLREYLISESIHALEISSTRSLGVMTTGEQVFRESVHKGAVLVRIAKSHIRVGTFQFAATTNTLALKKLADYTINRHFPEIMDSDNPYDELLKKVIELQSHLIAQWMSVGFIHGVMNTDNMSIAGETIDYGPCSFMNKYDQNTVYSSIDRHGRYAYRNQPSIGLWNVTRFAESILPLIHKDIEKARDKAMQSLNCFENKYKNNWLNIMRKKIGLIKSSPNDENFIQHFLMLMGESKSDFTNTFKNLNNPNFLAKNLSQREEFKAWNKKRVLLISEKHQKESESIMKKVNPYIIPRNHNVENAIEDATNGNMVTFVNLLEALKTPFTEPEEKQLMEPTNEEFDRSYKTYCGT